MRERMANPPDGETTLIAKEGSKIVGALRAIKHPDRNQIYAIYVLPEHHGRGIGTAMWQKAQQYLDSNKGRRARSRTRRPSPGPADAARAGLGPRRRGASARARLAVLRPADVERRGAAELDLQPFQIGDLAGAQAVAIADKNERRVTMGMAGAAGGAD
jgi:GNAT superfamily N-acetyltransferase